MSIIPRRYLSGYYLDFRPPSYFKPDPETLIVASILGEERRKDVKRRIAAGDLDEDLIGDWLTESKLDNPMRQAFGAIHPTLMGGEYLPALGQQEIEIARIVLASTTQDVFSIRARRTPKFIAYRVVDEYDTGFILSTHRSVKPLTLREMIRFINRTNRDDIDDVDRNGLVMTVLAMSLEHDPDPEGYLDFVTVHSSFYPDLTSYFDRLTAHSIDGGQLFHVHRGHHSV